MLTLDEAETLRATWLAAHIATSKSQEYTIGSRTLRYADAKFCEQQFNKYDQIVSGLRSGRGGGLRVFRVMPRDV